MKTFYLLLGTLLCMGRATAQQRNAMDFRHATGVGPYPIYIGLAIQHSSNQQAFERLVNPQSDRFGGIPGRIRMWGVETSLGAIHNTNSFLWIKGWRMHSTSMEVGYRHLFTNLADDFSRQLNLRQTMLSVRYGRRHTLYYPITIHWQVGAVVLHDMRVDLHDLNKGALVSSAGLRTSKLGLLGFEMRARLVLFDPVGASGGFSIFFEGQYIHLAERTDMRKFGDVTGASDYRGGPLSMGVFSFGTTIPLALRLR